MFQYIVVENTLAVFISWWIIELHRCLHEHLFPWGAPLPGCHGNRCTTRASEGEGAQGEFWHHCWAIIACALCNRLCQLTVLNSFLLQSSHTHVARHARFHTCFRLASAATHVIRVYCVIMCVCVWIKVDSFRPYCLGIRFLFQMMGIKEDPGSMVGVCVRVGGGWKLPNFVLWSSGWNMFHHVR